MAPVSLVSVVLLSLRMVASHAIGDQVCAEDYCGDAEAQAQAVHLLQANFHVTEGRANTDNGANCMDYTSQYVGYDNKKSNGATDRDGNGCSSYKNMEDECGKHDDEDFIAKEMCCSCGGGSTSVISRSIAVNKASVFISDSSDCPSGFEPITTLTACRAALDMVVCLDGRMKVLARSPTGPKVATSVKTPRVAAMVFGSTATQPAKPLRARNASARKATIPRL